MLDLLRAAAKYGERTDSRAMPENILAFEIEYQEQPNLPAEREKLENLLGAPNFDLFVLSEEDAPNVLVLQFPDVLREHSPELLFKESQELREALGALIVTPEIDAPYTDLLTAPPATEGLGEAVWQQCMSHLPGSNDPEWARKMMRVPEAEAKHGVTGQGVLIGQPDTGVARHDELTQGLDVSKGYDFLADAPDPTDPLSPSMASPGHGTGTSSVAISRPDGQVTGTARGATLVPVRVMNRVIIGLSGRAIANGIDHARRQGCQIITMSLGGLGSRSISAAVKRAVDADMIVLAAAGNCVGPVTFPATHRDVIAIAGVDHNKKKWKGSCSGPAVDVSAPGENVYVARRIAVPAGHVPGAGELADVNERGQGTSFAVALTAGVAALWIEHFGVAAIKDAARARGINVNELFRMALHQSADAPDGWDRKMMGEGIVDAEKLLDTALADLPGAPTPSVEAGPALAAFGKDFEGTSLEAEAAYLGFDWQMRTSEDFTARIETALPPAPSPALAKAIGQGQPEQFPAPAAIVGPATPPMTPQEAVQRLALHGARTLESTSNVNAESALEALRTEGTGDLIAQVENGFAQRAADDDVNLVNAQTQNEALKRMHALLEAMVSMSELPRIIPDEDRATLEALVRMTGRPAIRVKKDGSEVLDPRLGDWKSVLVPSRTRWQPLTQAVGRVDVQMPDGSWAHAGTGFLVGDGQVMTNRHVIDTFVDNLPTAPGGQDFHHRRKASIIFDPEAQDETSRFELTDIITAGKSRIGRFVDLGKLDMAVVRVNPDNGLGTLPPPINRDIVSMTDGSLNDILLSGYPARPKGSSGPASDSDDFLAFWDRIDELYGEEFGKQFLSPGKIMQRPGNVSGDPVGWAFTHDATTLGGNSGSAILSLHGEMNFCGLHFGGATLSQNFAHDIQTVLAEGDGIFDTSVLN